MFTLREPALIRLFPDRWIVSEHGSAALVPHERDVRVNGMIYDVYDAIRQRVAAGGVCLCNSSLPYCPS